MITEPIAMRDRYCTNVRWEIYHGWLGKAEPYMSMRFRDQHKAVTALILFGQTLACTESDPLMQPLQVNISLKSCINCVFTAFTSISVLFCSPIISYSLFYLFLLMTFGLRFELLFVQDLSSALCSFISWVCLLFLFCCI